MIISTPSKFLLEISATHIYQRIINGLKQALLQLGHTLVITYPQDFSSMDEYLLFINKEEPDFLLLTNSDCCLVCYSEELDGFPYEIMDIPVIFIHHDSIFTGLFSSIKINEKFQSFYRIKDRSWHFCLEYDNFLDLRSLGINNTFSISHASEFTKYAPPKDYTHEVSFLGHLIPDLDLEIIQNYPWSHTLQSHLWNRIVNLDTKLADYATEFATQKLGAVSDIAHFLSLKSTCKNNLIN